MKLLASLGLISMLTFANCGIGDTKADTGDAKGSTPKDECSEDDEDCELEFGKMHKKPSPNMRRPESKTAKA